QPGVDARRTNPGKNLLPNPTGFVLSSGRHDKVAPPTATGRRLSDAPRLSLQMRHGHGDIGVRVADCSGRFVDAGSASRGRYQSAGFESAAVLPESQTGNPFFPQRRAVARRYVRSQARARKI